MATLKAAVQSTLVTLGSAAVFPTASYAGDPPVLVEGASVAAASVEANETSAVFSPERRYGRSYKQDRAQWVWVLILQFHEEVIVTDFEQSILDDPPCIPRDVDTGNRQVRLRLLDSKYQHPARQDASNGTRLVCKFSADLSPS